MPDHQLLRIFLPADGLRHGFRPDFPPTELDRLRVRARNAMLLLDLHNCDAGYSPTRWQHGVLPEPFRDKVQVIFDGVDTSIWRPLADAPCRLGNREIPRDSAHRHLRVAWHGVNAWVRHLMRVAKKLCDRRRDVIFLIAGEDRICYGGDAKVTGGKSFKQWVLAQDNYDLSRFVFLGLVPPPVLAQLFNITDLHIYLTVPFVLSWSLFDALACGTTVLASDTAPVREIIEDGKNGLLVDFFDVNKIAEKANQVLDAPGDFKHLVLPAPNSSAALTASMFACPRCKNCTKQSCAHPQ